MHADSQPGYLTGLPSAQRDVLENVNGPGMAALQGYLSSGQAVAFLGAGASSPLYPLWQGLIAQLVDAAEGRLSAEQAATCLALARQSPEEVVEILRRQLGSAAYREALRQALKVRTDPESGRTWTAVHELTCRCPFKGVVTTNYDPGIVDARMRVRTRASATGFTTWTDELGLDRWRTGEVFGDAELPVLFAHGYHNQPDTVVLATREYRRAYQGKLSEVLGRLVDEGHLVWIGFSFADQRIATILHEVALGSGTRANPGSPPRHIAIMPWDPNASHNDPDIIARRTEIAYNSRLVLYPAPNDDHSALLRLLSSLVDRGYPPATDHPSRTVTRPVAIGMADATPATSLPTAWVPGFESSESFIGRVEELARLDRWSIDTDVSLIGITAWGGAGKTALINHWVDKLDGATRRSSVRGVFGWSFYADPSPEHWASTLLAWAAKVFGTAVGASLRQATAILSLLRELPLLLVLDGLEVIQEGLAEGGFGRLLDGTLREVLTGLCRVRQPGLTVLTSRFPFADLEPFDGSTARMLDVPPFTLVEGAALMAARGGGWLEERDRQSLVELVDGHALAVWVLAGLLGSALPVADLWTLRNELAVATRTDTRVTRVLRFYADRLTESDRYFVAALSLFNRPVYPSEILTVAKHKIFAERLQEWDSARIEIVVGAQLTGLVTMHPDGTLSAHPLVRDAFRPLVIGAAQMAAEVTLTGIPSLALADRATIPRATEAIELLLDASEWSGADGLYRARTDEGVLWRTLPAARLGQRTAMAFASPSRREKCSEFLGADRLNFYLNEAGLLSALAGDVTTAREYLPAVVELQRQHGATYEMVKTLQNLADCLGNLGEVVQAREAAAEALANAPVGSQLECTAHAYLAWTASMTGETALAEQHFSWRMRLSLAPRSSTYTR
jgi:hypothetical protein